jgi:hypothetical protein
VGNQLRRLREINLGRCQNIDDQGVMYLAEKMPSLTSIGLASCRNITDAAIYHICNYLPKLQALNLERCEHLTGQAIDYLSQKLPLLEELVLSNSLLINRLLRARGGRGVVPGGDAPAKVEAAGT